MLLQRVVDLFFRGLDFADLVRERVFGQDDVDRKFDDRNIEATNLKDSVSSNNSKPTSTSTFIAGAKPLGVTKVSKAGNQDQKNSDIVTPSKSDAITTKKVSKKAAVQKSKTDPAAQKKNTQKKSKTAKSPEKATAESKGSPKKKSKASRKGSVDRSARELKSETAEQLVLYWKGLNRELSSTDLVCDGKAGLGRVLWVLALAEEALGTGITTKDMAVCLNQLVDLDLFPTNLTRTLREHSEDFKEVGKEGRSKLFALSAKGKKKASKLFL